MIHVLLFFHKDKTTTLLPHNMQQPMCYSHICSKLEASSYWPFEWTSTVDGDTEQYFQASGPNIMHHMCYTCAKGFQL